MSAAVVPVVVVGGGPTGVTAATLLAQHGVDVLVLDRWAEVYAQPRAVHLDDEVYRIIARLGLADSFHKISRSSEGLRLLDPQHRVLAEFTRRESVGRHGFPQANMFDQPELEGMLRANLLLQPRVTFRGEVEVTGVHQSDGAPVLVELTDRTTGERETVLAEYVLGCDGANSVVREAIGAEMIDLRFQQRWLVVDVNTDRELGHWEGVHQICDTRRAATYMRISDRRHRWEFQLNDGETSEDFATVASLRPLIQPWTGNLHDSDLELVRVADYTFRAQLADRYRDRRLLILGDAAHLTPPFIGQGMGAGLRDAANLAWKLAGVLHATLPEDVLETYELERRPHALHMIRLAKLVGTAMTRGGRIGDVLRRLIAPRLHLVPGVRDKVVDSATPSLRVGGPALRTRWRRGLAGSLCPNLPVDSSRRFDDVAAGRFALVTTETIGPALTTATGSVVVIEVRPGEPLHDWLRRAGARAAVVRPDGTVVTSRRSTQAAVRTCALL